MAAAMPDGHSPMKGKLARGAAWIAATRAVINAIGFISTISLARLLLPQDFGLVAIATTVMAIVSSVTDISLSAALMQHSDPQPSHYDTAFTLNLIRSIAVAIIASALSWPVAAFYHDPRLVALITALAIVSALIGLTNPKLVILWRALVFWQEFLIGVSQKLLGFVAAVAIAWWYQSYWALVVGAAISQLASLILSYVLVRYRPSLSLVRTRELIGFSSWLTLSQIVATLNYRFDNLYIGYFFGAQTLGYYSYADNLAGIATREVTAPVANTLFAAYAQLKDQPERLRVAHARTQSVMFAIALPVGCGFAMIADPLVRLALGPKWLSIIPLVEIISVLGAVQTIGNTHYALALALGRTAKLFRRDVLNLVIRLPLLGIGLITGGFWGVVAARVVAGLIALAINLSLVRQLIGVTITTQISANSRPLIAVGAMAIGLGVWQAAIPLPVLIPEQIGNLAAQMTLGGIIYGSVTLLTWKVIGRPEGVEQDAMSLLELVNSRLRQRETT